jgi:hypothetical protein
MPEPVRVSVLVNNRRAEKTPLPGTFGYLNQTATVAKDPCLTGNVCFKLRHLHVYGARRRTP